MFSTSSTVNVPISSGARSNRSATRRISVTRSPSDRSAWASSSASRASSTALSSCSLDSKWCSRPAGGHARPLWRSGQATCCASRFAPGAARRRRESAACGPRPWPTASRTDGDLPCRGPQTAPGRTPDSFVTASANQPTEHTVGWFAGCDKGRRAERRLPARFCALLPQQLDARRCADSRLGVPSHEVGVSRLMGGRPPSAL